MHIPCSQPDCTYFTEEIAESLANILELLRIHTTACHSITDPASTPSRLSQAEREKRPILNISGESHGDVQTQARARAVRLNILGVIKFQGKTVRPENKKYWLQSAV